MAPAPRIRALDGMRVIAEYIVVRHHVLSEKEGWLHGTMGVDIMTFFFVLSGFVTMWMFHGEDLGTWDRRAQFMRSRITRIAPMFLLNWVVCLPNSVYSTISRACGIRLLCPFLQPFALDVWAGCGFGFLANVASWYLSCLVWLWVFWVCWKDHVVSLFRDRLPTLEDKFRVLAKASAAWSLQPIVLWSFDVYTVSPFPLVRAGDFFIGCGVACVLLYNLDTPMPWYLDRGRFWLPFVGMVFLYNLVLQKHGLSFLCLHEDMQHSECTLWNTVHKWRELTPPCPILWEKLVNKSNLVWAALIYGVGRAELLGENGAWTMRVLQCEAFQFLSGFSFTLYLSHNNVAFVLRKTTRVLLGWRHQDWSDDTLLLCTYVGCYGVHVAGKIGLERLGQAWRERRGGNNSYRLDEEERLEAILEEENEELLINSNDASKDGGKARFTID